MSLFSNSKEEGSKSWYADRYESVVVQRNLFFFLCLLCVGAVVIAVFLIGRLSLSKSIDPMVIEVEETTGMVNLVNPLEDRRWTVNKTIDQYFLVNYLRARETYDIASYLYNYNTFVRLMSSYSVYGDFKSTINDPSLSPIVKYAATNSTILKIRSIQFLPSTAGGSAAQIRFSIIEQGGAKQVHNKIVSILWNYVKMDLTFEDRMINPLGFQVQSYSIANDGNV